MKNNDILRRLRYIFDFDDSKMIAIFHQADLHVNREQVSAWLKKDDAAGFLNCNDLTLASFLNGLIVELRGKRESPMPIAEKKLNNNIILKKLKIALALQTQDVLSVLSLAGFRLSQHELSAFFRKADHKHYRQCKDQVIRNFLQGLQQELRPQRHADQTELMDREKCKASYWPRS